MTSNLTEIKCDLFDAKECLCHCVSADFYMGKGIAVEFKNRFGCVQELLSQKKGVGGVAILSIDGKKIFYLVTKEKYYLKPTYESLTNCLKELAEECIRLNIKHLAMPKIGCGLDKLKWQKVKKIIQKELCDIGIEVTVYYL
jgi:O-acetyl-ADP-ribose deacetylase (regulator of RNase III)